MIVQNIGGSFWTFSMKTCMRLLRKTASSYKESARFYRQAASLTPHKAIH